jgi:hypothetical protein
MKENMITAADIIKFGLPIKCLEAAVVAVCMFST